MNTEGEFIAPPNNHAMDQRIGLAGYGEQKLEVGVTDRRSWELESEDQLLW